MRPRIALRRDADAVAAALADAFCDDPIMAWLAGLDDRAARTELLRRAMFQPGVRASNRTGQGFLLEVDGNDGPSVAGAALWNPPDTNFFTAADGEHIASVFASEGPGVSLGRLGALSAMTRRHSFPEPTYFHLMFLGVTSTQRSKGLGTVLIEPVLQRCDLDGLPAALESSNPRNVSFYRRHGFDVVWEGAPDGGPTMQGMWREPRPV